MAAEAAQEAAESIVESCTAPDLGLLGECNQLTWRLSELEL